MQTAATEFVDVLPARINLGLVSFAGTATTLVPPTTDRDAVTGAIHGSTWPSRPRSARRCSRR